MRRIRRRESVLALRVRDAARRELLPRAGAVRRAPDGDRLRLALRRGSTDGEQEAAAVVDERDLDVGESGRKRALRPRVAAVRRTEQPGASDERPYDRGRGRAELRNRRERDRRWRRRARRGRGRRRSGGGGGRARCGRRRRRRIRLVRARREEQDKEEDRSHHVQRLTSGHRRHLATPPDPTDPTPKPTSRSQLTPRPTPTQTPAPR